MYFSGINQYLKLMSNCIINTSIAVKIASSLCYLLRKQCILFAKSKNKFLVLELFKYEFIKHIGVIDLAIPLALPAISPQNQC